jgi:hypothetical protein
MAKPLFRQPVLHRGGFIVGPDGSTIAESLFGTVDITCPSAAASDNGVRTASISNLDGSAQMFFTAGSLPQGFVLQSACADANGGEFSASFANVTTADISSSAIVTLQYFAIV